jgi:signal transduction histidine kinase
MKSLTISLSCVDRFATHHVLNGIEYLMHLPASEVPQAVRAELEICQKAGFAITGVLKNALDMSKLESSDESVKLQTQPTDITKLCSDCVQVARMSGQRKGIAVRHTIDGGPHTLHLLNNVRLTQVLMNLLSNAVSYTDQGTVELQVTWEHYDKLGDTDTISFRVIDTGKGIDKAAQADIFKKLEP